MTAARRLGHVLLFLVAAAFAIAGMRSATPPPTEMGLAAKLAFVREHKDELDAIYLGSSHVYRSFVPAVIDAELRARGHAIRSFNLGLPGMGDFESDELLDELIALRSKTLRWVILEPPRFDPTVYAANRSSARELAWHSTARTWAAVRAAWDGDPRARRALLLDHVELWARRQLNLGQGRRIVTEMLDGDPDLAEHGLDAAALDGGRGYRALEDERDDSIARRRASFLADTAGYSRAVAQDDAWRRRRPPLDGYPLDLLAEQVARLRAAGIEPIYVLPPAEKTRAIAFSLSEAGLLPHLVDLGSPSEHPELYTPDARYDRSHLDRAAARVFSTLFAVRFAAILDDAKAE